MTADLIDLFPGGFTVPATIEPEPPEHQLIDAMADHGIPCSEVHLDGELHRWGKGEVYWYRAWGDGVPAGIFGDWHNGISEKWRADIGRELTHEERHASILRIEQAREQRRAEKEEAHRRAAERAVTIWDELIDPNPEHPYLARKGISPGPCKMTEDGRLVLQMRDQEGGVSSLQFISPTGDKRFLKGGNVVGVLGHLGTLRGATRCYLAEGFATASTVHQATGCPVFWSWSAGNMPNVAEYLATLGVPMTIIADRDEKGAGQKAAQKASKLTGAPVVMTPELGDVNDYALAGGDVKQLLGHSDESWLVSFDDFTRQPRPIKWLAKGWIPERSLVMVFGPSGSGKTFFVLNLAMAIATNQSWCGNVVHGAPVAYLAGEGHAGLAARLKGWGIKYGADGARFHISRSGCKLDTPDGYNHAVTAIAALPERPGLILVDTLHRFLKGDENSAQDAGVMIEACDKLGREFGATVLLVHHTGHNVAHARGSTAWKGALEVEIGISKLDDGAVMVANNCKQKDVEEANDICGVLADVPLPWTDEDGEPVGTVVWQHCPAPESSPLDGVQDEFKLFQRAWFKSGAELHEEMPYVTQSALAGFLETENGFTPPQVKKAIDSPRGMVAKLNSAKILGSAPYGYCVINGMAASLLHFAKEER